MSAIDATFPATGVAVSKASERANWAAAKAEIDALQTIHTVNVGDYALGGVYPWSVNDDTAGINAAIAAANSQVAISSYANLWFPVKPGIAGFRVTSKLTNLSGGVNVIMDVPIVVHFDQATINNFVWTIGDPASRNYEVELKLWMATYGPATDYTVNPNFGAFQLINLNRSKVKCHQIAAFPTCLQLLSTGAGQYTTANVFDLGYIDGRWMLDLVVDGRITPATAATGAWMISNTFNGGAFGHDADRGGVDHAAVRCRVLNGAQNMHDLRFINPDIEVLHSGVRGDAFRSETDATTETDNVTTGGGIGMGGGASIYIENAYLEGNGKLAYSNPTNHSYIQIQGSVHRSDWSGTLEIDEWAPMGSYVTYTEMTRRPIPVDPRVTPPHVWWAPAYSALTKAAADAQGFRRISAITDVMGGASLIETGTTGPIWAGDVRYNASSGMWFDGATKWLKTASQTLGTTLGNVNNWRCRVEFIAYKASTGAGDLIIGAATSGGFQHWQIGVYTATGGEPRVWGQVRDSVGYKVREAGIFLGVRNVVEFWYDGTNIRLRVNGYVGDAIAAGAVAVTTQVMQIGTQDSVLFFKGEIYDIVFF
jgi:hypothetical protein